MAIYQIGQTVYAATTIKTDATGDHPAFLHAKHGDELIVIEHTDRKDFPYLLANNPEGKEPFYASPKEIMGQKPFAHNARG